MSDSTQLLIRFLLSDIDGTLLRPDHSLSQANIDAVRQLRESGIHFTIASSRPPRAMRQQIEALGIDLPTVAFNGANIIRPDGTLLKAHRIAPEAARTSLELFAAERVSVWVFADDQWLLLDPQGDYVEHERNTLGYDFVQVNDFDGYMDRIDKIVAASKDFELLKRLEVQLNPLIKESARAARSQSYYLDVTALDANKGTALETLSEELGVALPIRRPSVMRGTMWRCSCGPGCRLQWVRQKQQSRAKPITSPGATWRTDWRRPSSATSCRADGMPRMTCRRELAQDAFHASLSPWQRSVGGS